MRLLSSTAALVSVFAVAGCLHINAEDETLGQAQGRTEANADGCFPETLSGEFALCLCENFDQVGRVRLLQEVAGHPASLAVNGTTNLVASTYVEGSWHAHRGVDAVATADVRDDLITVRSFDFVGEQHIGGDLVVGGDLSGVGTIVVGGTVRVAGDTAVVGDKKAGAVGSYQSPGGAPCPCNGQSFFDVATAVADARTHNDNVEIGQSPSGIANVGDTEIVLPAGRFYIESMQAIGNLQVRATGQTALFIGGSLDVVGNQRFSVAPDASLDLYVAGSVGTVGNVDMGNPNDPTAFRLFVGGGSSGIVSVGVQHFHGYIYAPTAAIDYVGDTTINGGLFARALDGVGDLTVRYYGPADTAEETCEPVEEEPPPEEQDPCDPAQ
ncbi:MAG: hypothetical protein JRI68_11600 [Deltaproteobacteria bacterium]|nr:hypothetical protein [Deltaproteobacteria bacterium]